VIDFVIFILGLIACAWFWLWLDAGMSDQRIMGSMDKSASSAQSVDETA
jgi:hypothetical protein